MAAFDVVIIGGGAIGLSLAWRLRQRGATVAVLERGPFPNSITAVSPEGQATWAAAGMLAPLAECRLRTPLLDLGLASLRKWPHFGGELRESSGVNVHIEGPGMIRLARSPAEAAELREQMDWQKDLGLILHWLQPHEVTALEPALEREWGPAILSPMEQHVPPRSLLTALAAAGRRAGVHLEPHCTVTDFHRTGEKIISIETAGASFDCGELVLAGGCWTGEIANQLHLNIPVQPVRGQVAALRYARLLSHTIYTHDGYVVPRLDGQIISGATEDEAGFNSRPTAGGVLGLIEFATTLAPALKNAPFEGAWAGLRPVCPDHLPILGRASGWENVHIASGHFRNGILLTPITADLMSQLILDRKSNPLLDSVGPARFMESPHEPER